MPGGDGRGPVGRGMGTGRGRRVGPIGGRGVGAGPAGECICPACGTVVSHSRGIPCYQTRCPKCGTEMVKN